MTKVRPGAVPQRLQTNTLLTDVGSPQRTLGAISSEVIGAPGSVFMHAPQVVRTRGGACVPSGPYLGRCVSSHVLDVCHAAAALFERLVVALLFGRALSRGSRVHFTAG